MREDSVPYAPLTNRQSLGVGFSQCWMITGVPTSAHSYSVRAS